MDFNMAGINHEPLIIGFIDEPFEQALPDSLVAPTAEAAVDVIPAAIVRRQIAPGRARPQYPEHGVDKSPIILRNPSSLPFLSG